MAKLSLWLITLSKDRPFTFLDHAIKCGDSLLGVRSSEQLKYFSLDREMHSERNRRVQVLLGEAVTNRIAASVSIHNRIARLPTTYIADIEAKSRLHTQAALELGTIKGVA